MLWPGSQRIWLLCTYVMFVLEAGAFETNFIPSNHTRRVHQQPASDDHRMEGGGESHHRLGTRSFLPSNPPRPRTTSSRKQDAYQFCRQWTIAVFQHITENDFAVRLVGGSTKVLGADGYDEYHADEAGVGGVTGGVDGGRRWLGALENAVRSRYLAQTNGSYDVETDAGVDTVFSTVAIPAFYSALPPTVELLDDEFEIVEEVSVDAAAPRRKRPVCSRLHGAGEPTVKPSVVLSRTSAHLLQAVVCLF